MNSARSSPEEEQSSVPHCHLPGSVLTEEEIVMEGILHCPKSNEEETKEAGAAVSPLNSKIPRIATKKIKPLVISFWEQAASADLTQRESRETLGEMLLEVIAAVANQILEALNNMALERRERENPLLVSEEAVRRSVCCGLCDSFKAALGSTHESMNALLQVICKEVTSHINSTLNCSRIKGGRLVIPKECSYRPSKEKMKEMVSHARRMLRSFTEKVRLGCGGCIPTKKQSSLFGHQEEETSNTTCLYIKQKLGRSCSQKHEGELNIASPAAVSKTSAPVMSTKSKTVEEKKVPICSKSRLRETLGRCCSCGRRSEQQAFSDDEMNEEPGRTSSIKDATEEVEKILLAEVMELGGEESDLNHFRLLVATSIVNSIIEEITRIESGGSPIMDGICMTHFPRLVEVSKKIKGFFLLCHTKSTLRHLLSRLCCFPSARPDVSVEEVMEEVAPLLLEVGHEEGDLEDLSEQLIEVISTSMALTKSRPQFRKAVRMEVRSFMDHISNWMHTQAQLPGLEKLVQRTLGRIRRLALSLFCPVQTRPRAQLTEPVPIPPLPFDLHVSTSEVPLYLQPSQAPQEILVPSDIPAEAPMPSPDVHRATFDGPWNKKHCNMLVYEVVSRIFQKNWDMMLPLSEYLMVQLCEKLPEWDILVKPSARSCEEVASAVYKDLCKGQKKVHVTHAAFAQSDYSSEVLDAIHRHLTAPQKKRRTLGSFLRSVCSSIYRR